MSEVIDILKAHRTEFVGERDAAQAAIDDIDRAILALEQYHCPPKTKLDDRPRRYYSKFSKASTSQQRRREREATARQHAES